MTHQESEAGWSPQGPVVELSDQASWDLLKSKNFGHLAVSTDGRPDIFPINYYCDGATVLFRTASGTKLFELVENRAVAFEADSETPSNVWSVVIHGDAAVVDVDSIPSPAAIETLPPWAPVEPFVYVSIVPASIRGRLFEHHVPIGRA